MDMLMDTCIYTNGGKEVPLGVECAMPHLVHSTPPPVRGGAERAEQPRQCLERRGLDEPDPQRADVATMGPLRVAGGVIGGHHAGAFAALPCALSCAGASRCAMELA